MAEIEKKAKKPGVFSRMGKFLREYKAELGKVTWASRQDTLKNFVVVAITVVIAGVLIGVLDIAFSEGLRALGGLI